MTLSMIWAQDRRGVIGKAGTIPWHVPEDLRHFKEVTQGCPVIMGRATFESLPQRNRPLPGRDNIVLTRDGDWHTPSVSTAASVDAAVAAVGERSAWIIGGGEVYAQFTALAEYIERTVVDTQVEGEGLVYAPVLDPAHWVLANSGPWLLSTAGVRYRFETWKRAGKDVPAAL